ncbi:NAD(P)/FAD-dependent oxidoreductase [Phyllobacterium sp. YR531]|uniref:NAD(P)/FAD-dependent oxidoreductase n=1 Tax=Phyllobacterium sp. YR531 TaxID=1144343 RepID=UPI00026FA19D|nr:NAD(P)/FAD-dependent oxidoreductase [Phyllobacterium sp. YR531]EJN00550.1 putative NAD/FAD-binding protein [Phyllobacterium sp. YR531]
MKIAVVGTGISGMSAAWLLSQNNDVTVYEREHRIGGHSNTFLIERDNERPLPVDTGFIVFNEHTYPNLTALFAHLDVETAASEMSFAVSLDSGKLEYSGTGFSGLFAQQRNLFNPRFWMMLRDLLRFYRDTPSHAGKLGLIGLGEFLEREGYGAAFRDDHLLPMAAAIWSAPASTLLEYPAEAFIRFCDNHGLLKLSNRPLWRTVKGGSRSYVERLTASYKDRVKVGCAALSVQRGFNHVEIKDVNGETEIFDHVVMASHADETLGLLTDPSPMEQHLLSAFRYSINHAVLHEDESLMPTRRSVWSSWNYLGHRQEANAGSQLCVTYWMNRLQTLETDRQYFVTLNPRHQPDPQKVLHTQTYTHPVFDSQAMQAQKQLWQMQGERNTWYCGAYFGSGFHEDGLQAGLAVAEDLGGLRRPWMVENESSRIVRVPRNYGLEIAA